MLLSILSFDCFTNFLKINSCQFPSISIHSGKLKVSGNVVLPDGTTSPPSQGSCLRMSIQEEILCEGCEVPKLASFRISNPVMETYGKIAYQMTLNNPKPGARYVNITWRYFDVHLTSMTFKKRCIDVLFRSFP